MESPQKHNKRAERQERKSQRLRADDPRCFNCGLLDVEALMRVPVAKLPRRFLEHHHLAGRAASDFTVVLCRNCHAVLTDWQEDWDPRLRHPGTPVDRLAAYLQGLAEWLWALARKLGETAAWIEAHVRWLLAGMMGDAPTPGGIVHG